MRARASAPRSTGLPAPAGPCTTLLNSWQCSCGRAGLPGETVAFLGRPPWTPTALLCAFRFLGGIAKLQTNSQIPVISGSTQVKHHRAQRVTEIKVTVFSRAHSGLSPSTVRRTHASTCPSHLAGCPTIPVDVVLMCPPIELTGICGHLRVLRPDKETYAYDFFCS